MGTCIMLTLQPPYGIDKDYFRHVHGMLSFKLYSQDKTQDFQFQLKPRISIHSYQNKIDVSLALGIWANICLGLIFVLTPSPNLITLQYFSIHVWKTV